MINRFKNIEIKKVLIILVIILFAFSALFSLSSNDKIAILEIEGVIKNPKQYLESMRDISEDDSIKGLNDCVQEEKTINTYKWLNLKMPNKNSVTWIIIRFFFNRFR